MYLPEAAFCNLSSVWAFFARQVLDMLPGTILIPSPWRGVDVPGRLVVFDFSLFVAIFDHRDDDGGHQRWCWMIINL